MIKLKVIVKKEIGFHFKPKTEFRKKKKKKAKTFLVLIKS